MPLVVAVVVVVLSKSSLKTIAAILLKGISLIRQLKFTTRPARWLKGLTSPSFGMTEELAYARPAAVRTRACASTGGESRLATAKTDRRLREQSLHSSEIEFLARLNFKTVKSNPTKISIPIRRLIKGSRSTKQ